MKTTWSIQCPCCNYEFDGPKSVIDQHERNRRVYSAAPEMLAALKLAQSIIAKNWPGSGQMRYEKSVINGAIERALKG